MQHTEALGNSRRHHHQRHHRRQPLGGQSLTDPRRATEPDVSARFSDQTLYTLLEEHDQAPSLSHYELVKCMVRCFAEMSLCEG